MIGTTSRTLILCSLSWTLSAQSKSFLIDTGTHVPLSLINSISTKNAIVGDRVYLETVFPILADGRIVIPPGSYVMGTITDIRRPGKVKGRGEFHLRFDSLTLPNGTTRDFRAHVTGLDGRASEELDHKEGTIRSEGNKAGDVKTVGETAAAGASIGALAGSVSGAPGMGAAIGAGAGAAAANSLPRRSSASDGAGPLPGRKSQAPAYPGRIPRY